MLFRRAIPALIGAGCLCVCAAAVGADEEMSPQARQALKFVSGLRERGYHDIALEYLESLRKAPDTPDDLKVMLDYQEGRGMLEEATTSNELEAKAKLLDRARVLLDAFATGNPKHPLAPEALTQLARLYIERGSSALNQSRELKGAEADSRLAASRAAFAEARNSYGRALPLLKAAFDAFPKFIPDGNPKKEDRKRAHEALMDATLQRAIVDYEEAQTYALGAPQRAEWLDKAGAAFEQVYKDYRTQLAGQTALALQGKCYEEKGELGKAMGIYNDIHSQSINDPQFNDLRRRVAYYRIIVDGKRQEYALAVDEANTWLRENNARQRVSVYSLGVKLELAKDILAQLPDLKVSDQDEAMRKAAEQLKDVIRYLSPHKTEALALLDRYKLNKSTLTDAQINNLTFEDAKNQADSSMKTHEWDRAIRLWKQAIKRADPNKDIAKVNEARYFLAYCFFSSGRYYEAAILAEHLARRYPKREWSDKITDFGLAGYTEAYNKYTQIDRASDLDRLVDFARYVSETWPDSDQGDAARETLREVHMKPTRGDGHPDYADAAKAFESIRESSPRRLNAQVKAGDCHWRLGLILREAGKAPEADEQEKVAYQLTSSALEARKKAGTPPTDPSLITNTTALAEILKATGKPKEALALLEPLEKALAGQALSTEVAPLYEALLTVMLQAHIGDGQADKAIGDMKALETTGISRDKLTRLYYQLSQSLKREMDAQQSRKDTRSYAKTKDAYKKFLDQLAKSESGQTYDSLMFAGDSMLSLDMSKDAESVFKRMLDTYAKDPKFAGPPLLRLQLKMAEAMRKNHKFDDALELCDKLIKANPRQLEPLMERGYLLEDWARIDRSSGRWNASFNYWKDRATQFEKARPRRVEYFECVYHMAVALQGLDRGKDAVKTLRGVMTLSPHVGKPETKAKYEALLKQLGS